MRSPTEVESKESSEINPGKQEKAPDTKIRGLILGKKISDRRGSK